MDYCVTSEDIESIFGSKCRVMLYNQLSNIPNLMKFLSRVKFLFVLYNYADDFGHWIVLFKSPKYKNTVEFFDSYGTKPDYQLMEFTPLQREDNGMDYPALTELFLRGKCKVEYNDAPYKN